MSQHYIENNPHPELVVYMLEGKTKTDWYVVNIEDETVLCVGVVSDLRLMMYEPISFKNAEFAEKFIRGEITIGELQESMTELNIGFKKQFVYKRTNH